MGPWIDPETADNETLVDEFEIACRAGDHEFADEYKKEILKRLSEGERT